MAWKPIQWQGSDWDAGDWQGPVSGGPAPGSWKLPNWQGSNWEASHWQGTSEVAQNTGSVSFGAPSLAGSGSVTQPFSRGSGGGGQSILDRVSRPKSYTMRDPVFDPKPDKMLPRLKKRKRQQQEDALLLSNFDFVEAELVLK